MKLKDTKLGGKFLAFPNSFSVIVNAEEPIVNLPSLEEFEIVNAVGKGKDAVYWARTTQGFLLEGKVVGENVVWECNLGSHWETPASAAFRLKEEVAIYEMLPHTKSREKTLRSANAKLALVLAKLEQIDKVYNDKTLS